MKHILPTFISILAISSTALAEPPKTEKEFLARFRQAVSHGDARAIDELTYQEGMSEQDKAMSARANQSLVRYAYEIRDVALKDLTKDFPTSAIQYGKKVEMTGPPVGVVEVKYGAGASGASESSVSTMSPYTVIDGIYYLVGPKSSDLGWTGPRDNNIGFMVTGQDAEKAQILVEWNASGVDLIREFTEPSSTFWGQYIRAVKVTTESAESDLKLVVLENGATIFTSDPLQGKGTLVYQRKTEQPVE
jgi:hypothetical protein